MILKYLIPFDRQTMTCRLTTTEVAARLRAVTVKRHWFRYWRAVPGTFEGRIDADRFRVLTSAEGFQFFGWSRLRNLGRPVCIGRLSPAPGGCRLDIRFRPPIGHMLAIVYIVAFLAVWTRLYYAGGWKLEDSDDVLPLVLFPAILAFNYIVWTTTFWTMRKRALTALMRVLG